MRPWMGLVGVVGVCFTMSAFGFTLTRSPRGDIVKWPGRPHFNLVGNSSVTSGLTEQQMYNSIVIALRRWEAASGGFLSFDYWQGKDASKYIPNSDYNGESSIYFTQTGLGANVLGLTQVWYDTNTGQILESDTALNSRDFQFTANPKDTTGYGSGFSTRPRVFAENVITHELGHSFGLTHSGHLQTTMLHMESPEQAHLGCDDQVGVRNLYGLGGGSTGGLSGTVVSELGEAIGGAHVLVISERRGTVLGATLTDAQGRYSIDAIEDGPVVLGVEPFRPGFSVLPQYYQAFRNNYCAGGGTYQRTFLTQNIWVHSASHQEAPTLVAKCSAQVATGTKLDISGAGEAGAQFLVDVATGGSKYYALRVPSGGVRVRALSYTLYSAVQVRLSLLDSAGGVVSSRAVSPVFSGDSGYSDYDSSLEVDTLVAGDYWIRADFQVLSSGAFPGGPSLVDNTAAFVLSAMPSSISATVSGAFANNARCEMNENFAGYLSPAGDPPIHDPNASGGVGLCGTVERVGGGSTGGASSGAIVGWCLPWFLMIAAARQRYYSSLLQVKALQ